MPMVTCPSCGEDTFTISGWAEVDHCPFCGRPLAVSPPAIDRVVSVGRDRRRPAENHRLHPVGGRDD